MADRSKYQVITRKSLTRGWDIVNVADGAVLDTYRTRDEARDVARSFNAPLVSTDNHEHMHL